VSFIRSKDASTSKNIKRQLQTIATTIKEARADV